jgi:Asp-tRNA(Asn)/Glu-tRNA(Gln) amidotransferase A subunit family amidase
VGTDIVGSIRLPASFCGLFGHKPSQGRVPYYPPASPALVAGPMTRTVADAAAMMDLLSKEDLRDCTALPAGNAHYHVALHPPRKRMTLGLMIDSGQGIPTSPDVEKAVRNAAKLLEDAGHRVMEIAPPLEQEDIAAASCWYQHRVQNEMQRYSEEQQQRSPYMATWISSADKTTAAQLFAASERMWDIRRRLNRLFEDIDFLLCPTVPYTAFDAELPARDVNDLFEPWVNVYPFNLAENPASSINCGFDDAQMPVGLQIIGKRFDDLGVLQLSREFEEICPDAVLPVREPQPSATIDH